MSKFQIFREILIADAFFYKPPSLIKKGQAASGIIDFVKNYVNSHLDPKDTFGSVINIILPGVLAVSGSPIMAGLYEIARSFFGIDVGGMISSLISNIKSLISNGKKTTSDAVNDFVISTISQFIPSVDKNSANDDLLTEALNLKNEFIKNKHSSLLFYNSLYKTAQTKIKVFSKLLSALIPAISWIIKVALASAGFMVAEDAIHAVVGDKKTDDKKPTETEKPNEQTYKLKINPNYREENYNLPSSIWMISGNVNNIIDQLLVNWTVDIYPELKGHDPLIKSTQSFNNLVNLIKSYNKGNSDFFGIPDKFKSRKDVIDTIIPEIENELNKALKK